MKEVSGETTPPKIEASDLLKQRELDLKEQDLLLKQEEARVKSIQEDKKLKLDEYRLDSDVLLAVEKIKLEREKAAAQVEDSKELSAFSSARDLIGDDDDLEEILASLPLGAINELKRNPETAKQFDDVFGEGLSGMVLKD